MENIEKTENMENMAKLRVRREEGGRRKEDKMLRG